MVIGGIVNSWSSEGKRDVRRMKLQVGERVEVRSFDEGFEGSWHSGKVIRCEMLKRHVRYDNVLDDDGVNHLVEEMRVSNALDGYISSTSYPQRGWIRPLPPSIEFDMHDLKFSLCVDVNYLEGWWEGVIFDHCDGMEERKVFFPDLGDEMKIGINQMRITHDWNEVTEKWKRRRNWVFLELIEECERNTFVTVSPKQIWYDVRERKDFSMIRDWTFNEKKDLWRNMVTEVVGDYWTLTVQQVCERDLAKFQNEISCKSTGEVVSGAICSGKNEHRSSTYYSPAHWKPLTLSEIKCYPEAVEQYALPSAKNKAKWKEKVLKHLAYLGWKIELAERTNGGGIRYRYKSPDERAEKNVYYSLIELCKDMQKESNMNCFPSQNDLGIMHPIVDFYNIPHEPLNLMERVQDWEASPLIVTPPSEEVVEEKENCPQVMQKESNMNSSPSQNVLHIMHPTVDCVDVPHVPVNRLEKIQDLDASPLVAASPSVAVVEEQDYCPQAVVKYYIVHTFDKKMNRADKRILISRAKNHLLSEGWSFDYPPEDNKRKGITYYSPETRKFQTLHQACKFYIEKSIPIWTISLMQPLNVSGINEKMVDPLLSEDFLHRLLQLLPEEPELHTTDSVSGNRSTGNQKRKHLKNSKARLPKPQGNKLHLTVQNGSVSSGSHQKPLSVLSWLMDSNMVIPRSKVYYCEKKCKPHFRGEGRIAHDGIRCNCCQNVYNLAGFEYHASGSKTCSPCSSIFLEDGRSLLEVQRQIMQEYKSREIMEKPLNDLWPRDNDYVCSVCHYGGELILCDQCPSSFHKTCLGLEDIPDGDWFCPSCHCGICGKSRTNKDEGEHFLTCTQCEHKYHITCLENRDTGKSRQYVGKCFCGEGCEKIYDGLQRLLGESVSVGVDNLNWTLMKFPNSESCDLDKTNSDFLVETYSRLSVAILMMHECFEPLKESSSSRDLTEDVIFSRCSELNRLNFQGFYTVLLEKDEELVSVATIRVYGEKVAEVPLVGTRSKFRRRGMCHILMNELEKKLMQLGVEQLVLPAVPSVLETWTGSFGFMKMTSFERSKLLDYNFLDFQDTIMCQKKLLNKSMSPDQQKEMDTHDGNMDHDGSDVTDSQLMMVKEVEPSVEVEDKKCQNGYLPQCSLKKWDDSYKYYKRRKVKKLAEDSSVH